MEREELAAWLRLTLAPGLGNGTARKLLGSFGLPTAIFSQSPEALRQVVSPDQCEALLNETPELGRQIEATWAWLQQDPSQRQVVVLGDAGYPPSLLSIDDPPLLLYVMGRLDLPLESSTSLAIVGSRNPTPQGTLNARQFAHALSQTGLTIASGLALGVDAAAHEGALEAASPGSDRLATIAVVGTGLDRVYPKSHFQLAHRIAAQGWIVSEYPLGTPPLAANFPRRNRLIAGLSCATLVVEATLKSGSLITARLAADQGKDVFAIPGSIHSMQSHGCHALIRQGAKLVESAQDVLEELPTVKGLGTVRSSVTDEQASVASSDDGLLEAIGFDPVSLDALQARTGLATAALQSQLMALELEGLVARLPGGLFQRIAKA